MAALTVGLFVAVVSALLLMTAAAAQQMFEAARVPTIRVVKTQDKPQLTLHPHEKWCVAHAAPGPPQRPALPPCTAMPSRPRAASLP